MVHHFAVEILARRLQTHLGQRPACLRCKAFQGAVRFVRYPTLTSCIQTIAPPRRIPSNRPYSIVTRSSLNLSSEETSDFTKHRPFVQEMKMAPRFLVICLAGMMATLSSIFAEDKPGSPVVLVTITNNTEARIALRVSRRPVPPRVPALTPTVSTETTESLTPVILPTFTVDRTIQPCEVIALEFPPALYNVFIDGALAGKRSVTPKFGNLWIANPESWILDTEPNGQFWEWTLKIPSRPNFHFSNRPQDFPFLPQRTERPELSARPIPALPLRAIRVPGTNSAK